MANETVTVTQSTNSVTVTSANPAAGLGSGGTVQGNLDITQNLDVDGVLETDALTINGVSLAETIQDVVGAMVGSNTETGITVSYEDSDGTLDFAVASQTDENFTTALKNKLDGLSDQSASAIRALVESASDSNVFTDADHTKLNAIAANADVTLSSISAGSNISISAGGTISSTDTNTQLSNEQVQDIVGAMVTSNTETGISVSYDDTDGTLDFAVASQTDQNFTTADHSKLDGIEANADVTDTTNVVASLTAGSNITIAADGI